MPVAPQIQARHAELTARLASRHHSLSDLALASERRVTEHLAQCLLKRCYGQISPQESCTNLLARSFELLYTQHRPRTCASSDSIDAKTSEVVMLQPTTTSKVDILEKPLLTLPLNVSH
jgi:hypothetical protein